MLSFLSYLHVCATFLEWMAWKSRIAYWTSMNYWQYVLLLTAMIMHPKEIKAKINQNNLSNHIVIIIHTWTHVRTRAANDGVNCIIWLNDSPSKSNITTPPQICVVGSSIDAAIATWIARNMSVNEHLSVFHFSANKFKWTGKMLIFFFEKKKRIK